MTRRRERLNDIHYDTGDGAWCGDRLLGPAELTDNFRFVTCVSCRQRMQDEHVPKSSGDAMTRRRQRGQTMIVHNVDLSVLKRQRVALAELQLWLSGKALGDGLHAEKWRDTVEGVLNLLANLQEVEP
jgi:hypothetical protein